MAGITFHEDPRGGAAITNAQQPIEVDGSCSGIVEFQLTLHDNCCLDPNLQGFCARSERAGRFPAGRRYGLDIEATDVCGNVSAATPIGNIHVPRNRKPALTPLAPRHP